MGVDLLELAVAEIADNVSGGKFSKQQQRVWQNKLSQNNCLGTAGKRVQAESLQQNLHKKLVGREETFLQIFRTNHVENFSVPTFCGSFWKP